MEWAILLFAGFCYFVAKAGEPLMQTLLALAWGALALFCLWDPLRWLAGWLLTVQP